MDPKIRRGLAPLFYPPCFALQKVWWDMTDKSSVFSSSSVVCTFKWPDTHFDSIDLTQKNDVTSKQFKIKITVQCFG